MREASIPNTSAMALPDRPGALAAALLQSYAAPGAARAAVLTILGVTLAVIAVCAGLEGILIYGGAADEMPRSLDLSFEGGLPERVMQATALVAGGAFFVAYLLSRSLACLGLSWVYAFVWFDDGLRYHEYMGIWLADTFGFGPRFGLRPQDQGELLAWALAGSVLIVPLVLAWRRNAGADRAILMVFGLALALLAAAGAGADMANIRVTGDATKFAVTLIEDGGEMLAVAIAAAGALLLVHRQTG